MDTVDPFADCIITSSQEDLLSNCPFARQREHFPAAAASGDSSSSSSSQPCNFPEESNVIRMVSPPESPDPGDDFHTPPEDSLPVSSADPQPPDGCETNAAVDSPCTETERTVDLGKSLDNVGFRGEKSIAAGNTTAACDSACTETERTVDLGKDSDNPGFWGAKSKSVLESATEILDSNFSEARVLEGETEQVPEENSMDPKLKKLKFSGKISDDLQASKGEKASAEAVDLDADQVFDNLPMRDQGAEINLNGDVEPPTDRNRGFVVKSTEEIDKFKFVGQKSTVLSGGLRELPSSISEQPQKNQTMKNLLDALRIVKRGDEVHGGSLEEADFLETAMRRGMSFPLPRWWPPERFDH